MERNNLCAGAARAQVNMAHFLTVSIEQLGPMHVLNDGLCKALPLTSTLSRTLHGAREWAGVLDVSALSREVAAEVSALREAVYGLADLYPLLVRRPRSELVYEPLNALIVDLDNFLFRTENATARGGCLGPA
jgi:hypothetical protein